METTNVRSLLDRIYDENGPEVFIADLRSGIDQPWGYRTAMYADKRKFTGQMAMLMDPGTVELVATHGDGSQTRVRRQL